MFNRNFARLCTSLLLGVLIFLATGCGSKLSENKSNPSGVNIGQSPLLENITKTKTLRVGTTGDFMPFTYKIDSTDSYGGIDIEMAHDLAKSLDAKVVFIKTSWPTLMTDLKDGKFDIGMSGITSNWRMTLVVSVTNSRSRFLESLVMASLN